jgi:signal transduction histidine kinase
MRYSVLRNAAGERVGAYQFVYDVTDRLQEQARLREAEEQLRQSQKLETIGQLTGGVAHDFNNLLMAVIANLDLLRSRLSDPQLLRLVDGAMQGAERGAALTQRLLAFSRRQDLQPQVVHVPALVDGMRYLLEQSVGPMVKVEVQEGVGSTRPVLVDPNQLELAILNLVLNARDAMPSGGTATLTFDEVEVAGPSDLGLRPGGYFRLRVRDDGSGMDEATLKRAVEPFFRPRAWARERALACR